jgi:hypothetical protein
VHTDPTRLGSIATPRTAVLAPQAHWREHGRALGGLQQGGDAAARHGQLDAPGAPLVVAEIPPLLLVLGVSPGYSVTQSLRP